MSVKVTGVPSIEVYVKCPSCGESFDCLADDNDTDNCIINALFRNTTESCTDMDLELTCIECDAEFILDKIEY